MKLTEKLKEVLGDKFDEVEKLLGDKIDEEFVDINEDGAHIPKGRFDQINNKYKEMKTLNEKLEQDLETLKNDPEASELQEKIETLTKELTESNQKIQSFEKESFEKEKSSYIDNLLKTYQCKDVDYVKFKLETNNLEYKEKKIDGLEEKIKELTQDESLKSFFGETKEIGFEDNNNNDETNTNTNKKYTDEEILSMSPAQMVELGIV